VNTKHSRSEKKGKGTFQRRPQRSRPLFVFTVQICQNGKVDSRGDGCFNANPDMENEADLAFVLQFIAMEWHRAKIQCRHSFNATRMVFSRISQPP